MKKEFTKEEIIQLAEGTVVPSLNEVVLQRHSTIDFLYKYNSIYPNIAELYHQNTRLNEYTKQCIITDNQLIKEVKNWYLTTTGKIKEDDINHRYKHEILKDITTFSNNLGKLFEGFTTEQGEEIYLLYDVNLFLLYEQKVYRIIPMSNYLLIELKVDEEYIKKLKSWIIIDEKERLNEIENFIFIVGVPWRNMIFYGERGYRKLLLASGEVLYYLSKQAQKNGFELAIFENFYDNKINQLLNLDGIENFVIVIIGVKESTNEKRTDK